MWQKILQVGGSDSGDSKAEFTNITEFVLAKGGAKTISDLTKDRYLLIASINYTDTVSNRNGIWLIDGDTITLLGAGIGNFCVSTRSGSTLTVKNPNGNSSSSYRLLEIDE